MNASGRRSFTRRIDDPPATVEGEAAFELVRPGLVRVRETGVHTPSDAAAPPHRVHRAWYVVADGPTGFRLAISSIDVPLREIEPGVWAGADVCGADRYAITLRPDRSGRLQTVWRIIGPRKRHVITTVYRVMAT